jgi:hypothetical protein
VALGINRFVHFAGKEGASRMRQQNERYEERAKGLG